MHAHVSNRGHNVSQKLNLQHYVADSKSLDGQGLRSVIPLVVVSQKLCFRSSWLCSSNLPVISYRWGEGFLPHSVCHTVYSLCHRSDLSLCMMVDLEVFTSIELSFLMVGHAHEDIDRMFSR